MPRSKVLVIALDSLNHEALAPHLNDGRLPTIAGLLRGGTSGILESTTPSHTAPAWTTLATGKHPGLHGLLNFRRFDPRAQSSRLNSAQDVAHKTVWQLLDEAGLKVGVVGQPESYPARPLKNGFVITGFETPSTACEFTAPPELKDEVQRLFPGFCFRSEHVRDPMAGGDWGTWENFEAGMKGLRAENERTHALILHLAKTRPWDVLFAYYQAPDLLFHKAWRWCDAATRGEDPRRASQIDRLFDRQDKMIEELLASPEARDATVIICSDHGHGPVHELVRLNGVLADTGFLRRGGLLAQSREAWRRLTGRRKGKGMGLALDWSGTRAYMPFEAIAGFVYLNQIGREPFGIVPEAQVQAVTAELLQTLAARRSPFTGKPLFDAVRRVDEVYPVRGPFAFPDIFVLPAQGVNLVRKLSFGDAVEIPQALHRGTHRPHGIFALKGAGVLAGRQDQRASLADIAPTILALTGTAIPDDMTGRVLNEFFNPPLTETRTAAEQLSGEAFGKNVYSEAESKTVEQRLADLGYVD